MTDHPLDKSGARVRAMFSDIAPTYDCLNHGLSCNQDTRWRRRAVRLLSPRVDELILDLCCGTGDLGFEMLRRQPQARVVGADFALPMLDLAQLKASVRALRIVPFLASDALRLPFPDATFDAVAVAFGVRNFEDTRAGICEIHRVLKPGGRLLVLEFMRQQSGAVRGFFSAFNCVLAPIGRMVSHHPTAYSYLPASVNDFYTSREFAALLRDCGYNDVRAFDHSLGVATSTLARKPRPSTL